MSSTDEKDAIKGIVGIIGPPLHDLIRPSTLVIGDTLGRAVKVVSGFANL